MVDNFWNQVETPKVGKFCMDYREIDNTGVDPVIE